MKRILVADDHVLMHEGILQLFSKHRAWAQSETITRQYLGSRVFNLLSVQSFLSLRIRCTRRLAVAYADLKQKLHDLKSYLFNSCLRYILLIYRPKTLYF
jgi:hypothetical protein